jgi:hypothetical protein
LARRTGGVSDGAFARLIIASLGQGKEETKPV